MINYSCCLGLGSSSKGLCWQLTVYKTIYFSDCVMEWRVSICRLFAFNWAAGLGVCWPLESRYKAGGGREVAGVEILDTNRFYNKTPIISAQPALPTSLLKWSKHENLFVLSQFTQKDRWWILEWWYDPIKILGNDCPRGRRWNDPLGWAPHTKNTR